MCRELEYELGPDAEPALRAYMAKRMTMPFFANARTVSRARPPAAARPRRPRHGAGPQPRSAGRVYMHGAGGAAWRRGWLCRGTRGTASAAAAMTLPRPARAMADPSPYPSPHPNPWQIRNAIDLGRMRAAIRVFNEKTAPGSDGMVEPWELQTLQGCDFPTVEELDAAMETQGLAF